MNYVVHFIRGLNASNAYIKHDTVCLLSCAVKYLRIAYKIQHDRLVALQGGGNGGREVGAGTISRSHALRTVENSPGLVMQNAASPVEVTRSLPKSCAGVQMRASFIAVRKFEARCLIV